MSGEIFNVGYQFKLDQKVVTPLGDEGVVEMLGYDHSGVQYYIRTKVQGAWYRFDQLKAT